MRGAPGSRGRAVSRRGPRIVRGARRRRGRDASPPRPRPRRTGKEEKEIFRYHTLLKTAHPTHPYVVKMNKAEAEFDEHAAKYLEQEGIDPETLEKK